MSPAGLTSVEIAPWLAVSAWCAATAPASAVAAARAVAIAIRMLMVRMLVIGIPPFD
jgi:hypothetical protein